MGLRGSTFLFLENIHLSLYTMKWVSWLQLVLKKFRPCCIMCVYIKTEIENDRINALNVDNWGMEGGV